MSAVLEQPYTDFSEICPIDGKPAVYLKVIDYVACSFCGYNVSSTPTDHEHTPRDYVWPVYYHYDRQLGEAHVWHYMDSPIWEKQKSGPVCENCLAGTPHGGPQGDCVCQCHVDPENFYVTEIAPDGTLTSRRLKEPTK